MLLSAGEPVTRPTADVGFGSILQTVSILRIGAGASLMYFHGWPGGIGAYRFLWEEKAWDWVSAFEKGGMPVPHLLAPLAAVMIALIAGGWAIGFLTRLFSFFAIPVALGALVIAQRIDPSQVEGVFLYLAIAITLLLFGSGNVSVDWFFNLARGKKEAVSSW
jgi:uncharacterized membrane protein YphA (DoxX/SURF4 family)